MRGKRKEAIYKITTHENLNHCCCEKCLKISQETQNVGRYLILRHCWCTANARTKRKTSPFTRFLVNHGSNSCTPKPGEILHSHSTISFFYQLPNSIIIWEDSITFPDWFLSYLRADLIYLMILFPNMYFMMIAWQCGSVISDYRISVLLDFTIR